MLNGSAHKPVCNPGERAGCDELRRSQQFAICSRRGHPVIDVPLGENALCIFERSKLDGDAYPDAQERGERSLDIKMA